jgi:microcystin-dependent protein
VSKHRPLNYGDPVPQDFLDALQEFIGTMASPNLLLTQISANQVQVSAGTASAQVSIGIDGLWRYNTGPQLATVGPTGTGTWSIYATTGNNSFAVNPTPPPPELDSTVYGFGLEAHFAALTPSTAHYRKIGEAVWDGSRIISLRQTVGGVDGAQLAQTGDLKLSASAVTSTNPPAGWLVCNGQAVNITDYPALYAALGGTSSPWGLPPGGTQFNVPNLTGRVPVGAGGVGTASGASGHPLGQTPTSGAGGEEKHVLLIGELAQHSHRSDNAHGSGGLTGTGLTGTGTTGNDSPDHAHADAGHAHGINVANSATWNKVTGGNWTGPGIGGAGTAVASANIGGAGNRHAHSVPQLSVPALGINPNGSDTGHNTMQPHAAVNYWIKT